MPLSRGEWYLYLKNVPNRFFLHHFIQKRGQKLSMFFLTYIDCFDIFAVGFFILKVFHVIIIMI